MLMAKCQNVLKFVMMNYVCACWYIGKDFPQVVAVETLQDMKALANKPSLNKGNIYHKFKWRISQELHKLFNIP